MEVTLVVVIISCDEINVALFLLFGNIFYLLQLEVANNTNPYDNPVGN